MRWNKACSLAAIQQEGGSHLVRTFDMRLVYRISLFDSNTIAINFIGECVDRHEIFSHDALPYHQPAEESICQNVLELPSSSSVLYC